MAEGSDQGAAERLGRVADAQALLNEVGRGLAPTLDLDVLVKSVLEAMRRLVSFRGGSICVVEGDTLRIAASDPEVTAEVSDLRLPVGSGIAGRVAATGETVYSPDLDADARVDPEVRRLGSNAGRVSYLGVPMICLGEVIGVLQVDSGRRGAFDEVDVVLLEGLAALSATAIESARLHAEKQRLDELKRDFIQLVSHELRTPLTIATGMLQAFRTADETSEPEALLDRAEVALSRLGRLIEELILMSQLSGGDVVVRHAPVDLAALVDDVIARCADPALMRADVDDTALVTDGQFLTRILDALVENAVLYAGGGMVEVSDGVIAVCDRGPGLPADVAGREFDHFTRAAGNDTTIAGLGLGLTMARALVAELEGDLSIESRVGEGTEVRVRLPPR